MLIDVAKRPSNKSEPTGFGARLRALREEKEMTLAQLGEASGLHLQAIAKLERGVGSPTWLTVLKLAKALGVETTAFQPDAE